MVFPFTGNKNPCTVLKLIAVVKILYKYVKKPIVNFLLLNSHVNI